MHNEGEVLILLEIIPAGQESGRSAGGSRAAAIEISMQSGRERNCGAES